MATRAKTTVQADVVVIDGRHMLWRTSDAFSTLSYEAPDGTDHFSGGIYGFVMCVVRVHRRYGGRVVVAWEGKDNFRLKLYPQYKHRHEAPDEARTEQVEEMWGQELELRGLLSQIGVNQYVGHRCEADDVIGRLARECSERGERCVIYSGDSDLRQLVRDGVWAVCPSGREDAVYDEAAVLARHGVAPRLIAQLKALAGDHSDNIPGAPGIGEKTAARLLEHYRSLRRTLDAATAQSNGWPTTDRHRGIVAAARADIELFYKLTKIRDDRDWDELPGKRDQSKVVNSFKLYKFRSLLAPPELRDVMNLGGKQ